LLNKASKTASAKSFIKRRSLAILPGIDDMCLIMGAEGMISRMIFPGFFYFII